MLQIFSLLCFILTELFKTIKLFSLKIRLGKEKKKSTLTLCFVVHMNNLSQKVLCNQWKEYYLFVYSCSKIPWQENEKLKYFQNKEPKT